MNLSDFIWFWFAIVVATSSLISGIAFLSLAQKTDFFCSGKRLHLEAYMIVRLLVLMLYDSSREILNISPFQAICLALLLLLVAFTKPMEPVYGGNVRTFLIRLSTTRGFVWGMFLLVVVAGIVVRFSIHSFSSITYRDWSPLVKEDSEIPVPNINMSERLGVAWGGIVTNSYNNDTDWLVSHQDLLHKQGLEILIYDRRVPEAGHFAPNIGREATPMALFVYQYYNHLPDWTFFIHGHNMSFHQEFEMLELLLRARIMVEAERGEVSVFQLVAENDTAGGLMFDWDHGQKICAYKAWEVLFPDEPKPEALEHCLYAQYAVHRSVLLRRSREDWGFLYRFFTSAPVSQWPFVDWHVGYIAELLWLHWFKEPFEAVRKVPNILFSTTTLPPFE